MIDEYYLAVHDQWTSFDTVWSVWWDGQWVHAIGRGGEYVDRVTPNHAYSILAATREEADRVAGLMRKAAYRDEDARAELVTLAWRGPSPDWGKTLPRWWSVYADRRRDAIRAEAERQMKIDTLDHGMVDRLVAGADVSALADFLCQECTAFYGESHFLYLPDSMWEVAAAEAAGIPMIKDDGSPVYIEICCAIYAHQVAYARVLDLAIDLLHERGVIGAEIGAEMDRDNTRPRRWQLEPAFHHLATRFRAI